MTLNNPKPRVGNVPSATARAYRQAVEDYTRRAAISPVLPAPYIAVRCENYPGFVVTNTSNGKTTIVPAYYYGLLAAALSDLTTSPVPG